jgi:hypothetical protein
MNRCGDTDHRFAKFDDATIFCQRCGEQRVMDVQALIAKLPTITYLSCPHPHWSPYVYPTWLPTITYGTVTTGSTTSAPLDDHNVTYTVIS